MLKPSIYTVVYADDACAEHDGERVAFNTLTGALVVFDDGVRAVLDGSTLEPPSSRVVDASADQNLQGACFREEEVRAIIGAEACDALVAAGFLVDAGLDEQAELERCFMRDMNETSFLSLCIAPTMACNLRCVYCYEDHEPIRMTREVEDAIMRFVERRYEAYRFTLLDIEWYGGEPMLEIDLIERLSARFQTFCTQYGIAYHASAVTNGTLIDDAMACRLRKAGVSEVMPTLDGQAATHDIRRCTVTGAGSFEQTKAGIRACADAGIYVGANCNLDRTSVEGYRALRDEYASIPNVDIFASHLRNYGNWCGAGAPEHDRSHAVEADAPAPCVACALEGEGSRSSALEDAYSENACAVAGASCGGSSGEDGTAMAKAEAEAPGLAQPFDSRAAYAHQLFELYAETNPSAASLMASLAPHRSFCRGKMAAYFVIDPEGNVCRCDGFMRNPSHVLFNACDPDCPIDYPETRSFFDKNPRCAGCVVAPQCLGDCDWEWSMFDDNCNALKYTLDRYVLLLRRRLKEEGAAVGREAPAARGEGSSAPAPHVCVLVPPRDLDAFYAEPFSPLGGVVGLVD